MNISRNNYEHYFLDYIEGKLTSEEEDKLRSFLQFNPDLSDELKGFELLNLPENTLIYPGKETLKKSFPKETEMAEDQNFDMFSVAYLEKDLNKEQRISFESYIQKNPEKSKEYALLKNAVVIPENIVFPQKSRLKRRKPTVIKLTTALAFSAAASIALLLVFGPRDAGIPEQIAYTSSTPEIIEEKVEESPKENPVKQTPSAAIKLIRNSKKPVPVTNLSAEQLRKGKEAAKNSQNKSESKKRIATVNLKKAAIREVNTRFDQLVFLPVAPPKINRTSLSLAEQARYEYSRATKLAEDEDVFIWNLASNGIKELNRLTGSDMKLLASKNQEGDISGIQFTSRYLQLTTPIVKDEE